MLLAKGTTVLNGSSPTVMVSRSCFNRSSVMAPYFLVLIEENIGEGSLVLAIDFH